MGVLPYPFLFFRLHETSRKNKKGQGIRQIICSRRKEPRVFQGKSQ
jgi:hypothetical protein